MSQGPLAGIRVLEFAGIGPAPFCGMLLSDMGADVVVVDRPDRVPPLPTAVTSRGRCRLAADLKSDAGRDLCLGLADKADILIEGFRPGVMERLGLGPEVLLARRPALVYGRMTGWGQHGPYAARAGHDIDYIAITGALHAIGVADKPVPPLNLVGDFGGGALYLAFGVMAALHHARQRGVGQVVDCAITDGTASLMAATYGARAAAAWTDRRADNRLDGGAPYYDTYRCADGEWIAIGAIEPQFFAEMLAVLGLDAGDFGDPIDRASWPALRDAVAARVATQPAGHWIARAKGDACIAPVLSMGTAPDDPHNRARSTFVEHLGVTQPAPAPRFSVTPGAIQRGPRGQEAIADHLAGWGVTWPPQR